MNPLNTDYISHDSIYQRLKAEGAFGWTSEDDHTQVVRPRILQAIKQLSIPSGGRILDLGCGTGDITTWLGLEGYEAYGIDVAPSAIAWANEKAQVQKSQVQFTVGSVLDLAVYEDDFFHLVVDGRGLHCIIGSDRAATLASGTLTMKTPLPCFTTTWKSKWRRITTRKVQNCNSSLKLRCNG